MEQKTARLTLLIDPNKKAAFERLCAQLDLTPSQVVRQLIRDYLKANGVEYVLSGAVAPSSARAEKPKSARGKAANGSLPAAAKRSPARRRA